MADHRILLAPVHPATPATAGNPVFFAYQNGCNLLRYRPGFDYPSRTNSKQRLVELDHPLVWELGTSRSGLNWWKATSNHRRADNPPLEWPLNGIPLSLPLFVQTSASSVEPHSAFRLQHFPHCPAVDAMDPSVREFQRTATRWGDGRRRNGQHYGQEILATPYFCSKPTSLRLPSGACEPARRFSGRSAWDCRYHASAKFPCVAAHFHSISTGDAASAVDAINCSPEPPRIPGSDPAWRGVTAAGRAEFVRFAVASAVMTHERDEGQHGEREDNSHVWNDYRACYLSIVNPRWTNTWFVDAYGRGRIRSQERANPTF